MGKLVMSMKVKLGKDEFCLTCMEWREFDDNGKCKVCSSIIKKKDNQQQSTKIDLEKYSIDDFSGEDDSEVDDF